MHKEINEKEINNVYNTTYIFSSAKHLDPRDYPRNQIFRTVPNRTTLVTITNESPIRRKRGGGGTRTSLFCARSRGASPSLGARRCVVLQIPPRASKRSFGSPPPIGRISFLSFFFLTAHAFYFFSRDSKIAGALGSVVPPALPRRGSEPSSDPRSSRRARNDDSLFTRFPHTLGLEHAPPGVVASVWRQSWIKYYFESIARFCPRVLDVTCNDVLPPFPCTAPFKALLSSPCDLETPLEQGGCLVGVESCGKWNRRAR